MSSVRLGQEFDVDVDAIAATMQGHSKGNYNIINFFVKSNAGFTKNKIEKLFIIIFELHYCKLHFFREINSDVQIISILLVVSLSDTYCDQL